MEPELTTRPRVVFLSNGGLLGDLVLRRLQQSGKFHLTGVVRSRRVMLRGAGFLRGAAAYFLRCGVIYTVYIWTITTFAEFIGLFTGTGSITARAQRHRIPVLHTRDINDAKGQSFIRQCAPDMLVSAHFDQRLYPPLCDSPSLAVVNIHPSLLPDYRGLEPVLHTMREKRTEFGVTLHRLSPTIDAGAILQSRPHTAEPHHSVLRITHDLGRAGADLLISHPHQALATGEGHPQSPDGSYHSWPTGQQVRQLYFGGKHLLKPADLRLFWRDD